MTNEKPQLKISILNGKWITTNSKEITDSHMLSLEWKYKILLNAIRFAFITGKKYMCNKCISLTKSTHGLGSSLF